MLGSFPNLDFRPLVHDIETLRIDENPIPAAARDLANQTELFEGAQSLGYGVGDERRPCREE